MPLKLLQVGQRGFALQAKDRYIQSDLLTVSQRHIQWWYLARTVQ